MKTDHTPGPWKILENARGRGRTCVTTANGAPIHAIICETDTKSVGTDDAIRLANARLIAAAPELLDALKNTLAMLELLNAPGAHDPIEARVHQARAAISKAEGNA